MWVGKDSIWVCAFPILSGIGLECVHVVDLKTVTLSNRVLSIIAGYRAAHYDIEENRRKVHVLIRQRGVFRLPQNHMGVR